MDTPPHIPRLLVLASARCDRAPYSSLALRIFLPTSSELQWALGTLRLLRRSAECLGESRPEALQRSGQDSWDKCGRRTANLPINDFRPGGRLEGLAELGRWPRPVLVLRKRLDGLDGSRSNKLCGTGCNVTSLGAQKPGWGI